MIAVNSKVKQLPNEQVMTVTKINGNLATCHWVNDGDVWSNVQSIIVDLSLLTEVF